MTKTKTKASVPVYRTKALLPCYHLNLWLPRGSHLNESFKKLSSADSDVCNVHQHVASYSPGFTESRISVRSLKMYSPTGLRAPLIIRQFSVRFLSVTFSCQSLYIIASIHNVNWLVKPHCILSSIRSVPSAADVASLSQRSFRSSPA